ncbi:hypothetical protein AAG570_012116 [Ranatra chinensis]|uniref:Ubiquitin fusion degradaton protein n=1 Tax=Ranatra chinensis TaxID=642074 RepID=A0ABD0YHV3_9HEMI
MQGKYPDVNMTGYSKDLYCVSVSDLRGRPRDDIEHGGKILLPPSILDTLSRLNISYPMLFKLKNPSVDKTTHCGVLEFTADEDTICVPTWIMLTLCVNPGELVNVESVSLPTATYTRFQPQCELFLDISNPKAVLENSLRKFACLTTGDTFAIMYNNRVYELKVEETKPGNAVSIIECDMEVDFSPPEGYVDPSVFPKKRVSKEINETRKFKPFSGKGLRLDGKDEKISPNMMQVQNDENEDIVYGIPDYNYEIGTIIFFRDVPQLKKKETEKFKPFFGKGRQLDDGTSSDGVSR